MTPVAEPAERRVRPSARLLVLDPGGAALLFFERASPRTALPPRWCTPGGGVEPGESVRDAAIRELREEVGIVVDSVGEPVTEVETVIRDPDASYTHAHGTYFVVRVPERVDPSDAEWTDDERVTILDWRWWTAEELEALGERCSPASIPALIRAYR